MEKTKKPSRGRTFDGAPNPVDTHVGERVKLRRVMLGMSQEKLGMLMGLTFQQVQKYEHGMNRIGASRLWDLAKVLEVDINYFFEDMPSEIAKQSPRKLIIKQLDIEDSLPDPDFYDPMQDKEIIEMITAFSQIKNPKVRTHFRELILLSARSAPFQPTKEEA